MPIKSIIGESSVAYFSAAAALTLAPLAIDRVVYSLFKKSQVATAAGTIAVLGSFAIPHLSRQMKALVAVVYFIFKSYRALAAPSTTSVSHCV